MYTHKKGSALWWIIGVIALAVIAYFVFRPERPTVQTQNPGAVNGVTAENSKVNLEGEIACLPHRDTTGPTTMECAYGLKTDDGTYYGLDASRVSPSVPPEYEVGNRIAVEGTLVAQNDMPTNFWNTYNIAGYILMDSYWKFTEK